MTRAFQEMAAQAFSQRSIELCAGRDPGLCEFPATAAELKIMGKRAFDGDDPRPDAGYTGRLYGLRLVLAVSDE